MAKTRLIVGILSIFLATYMMSSAKVERYSHETKGSWRRVALVVPAADPYVSHKSFSALWSLIPLAYGIYSILLGELECFKERKKKAIVD